MLLTTLPSLQPQFLNRKTKTKQILLQGQTQERLPPVLSALLTRTDRHLGPEKHLETLRLLNRVLIQAGK